MLKHCFHWTSDRAIRSTWFFALAYEPVIHNAYMIKLVSKYLHPVATGSGLGSSLDHTESFRFSFLCSAQGSLERLHLNPHQLTVQLTAMEVNDEGPF